MKTSDLKIQNNFPSKIIYFKLVKSMNYWHVVLNTLFEFMKTKSL